MKLKFFCITYVKVQNYKCNKEYFAFGAAEFMILDEGPGLSGWLRGGDSFRRVGGWVPGKFCKSLIKSKSLIECFNCGKKGHFTGQKHEDDEDIKANAAIEQGNEMNCASFPKNVPIQRIAENNVAAVKLS